MKKIIFIFLITLVPIISFSQKKTNRNVANVTINGLLYRDINGNGNKEFSEPGVEGVQVVIFQSDGFTNIATTLNDGTWSYSVPTGSTIITYFNAQLNGILPLLGRFQTQGSYSNTVNVTTNQEIDKDGFFYAGTLTGHLFKDKNGDGTEALPDVALPNVNVKITDIHGNVKTVISDANGDWSADKIGVGNATVLVDIADPDFPAGTSQTAGTNPTTHLVTVGATTFTEKDGFFENGITKGHVYMDSNGNFVQDAGEPNLQNIKIIITDVYNNVYNNVFTDVSGNWTQIVPLGATKIDIDQNFGNFPIGSVKKEGFVLPKTLIVTNNISSGDFGNFGYYNKGTIKGKIYYDKNNNFTQDTGEFGIPNVNVTISASSTTPIVTQTLADGSYSVAVIATSSVVYSALIDILDTDFPSGATKTEGANPTTFVPVIDSEVSSINVGWYSTGTITGHLYIDTNGNGIQDFGELDLSNVTVSILNSNNVIVNVTTNLNGNWTATLPVGQTTFTVVTTSAGFPVGSIPTGTKSIVTNFNVTNSTISPSELNIGFITKASLSGHIYSDTNNNGSQQTSTDPDLPNIFVNITDTAGTQTVTTNNNGNWNAYVSPGLVTITINTTSTVSITGSVQTQGTNPTTLTAVVSTTPIATTPCGFYKTLDKDGDGIKDDDENQNGTDPNNSCDPVQNVGYIGYDSTNALWQTSDCDGDGIRNGDEYIGNSDPYDPCSPKQQPGYTGYDHTNPIWQAADCDDDGGGNEDEYENGTDPYDPNDDGVKIYNAVSPNGDSKNETFYIVGLKNFKENKLEIFNRWGVEVYNVTNYNNDFKGISKGSMTVKEDDKLPSGTYFYKLNLTKKNGEEKLLVGYLYIN